MNFKSTALVIITLLQCNKAWSPIDTLPLFNIRNQKSVASEERFDLSKYSKYSLFKKRMTHAKELLGSSYYRSAVPATSNEKKVIPYVNALVHKFVSKNERRLANTISKTIITESEKYNFDPLFLVAIIQNESSFKTRQMGPIGEIGLMQLRPETAKWIAGKFKIKYSGKNDLYNPVHNIKLGVAFLSLLQKQFNNKGQLYVSAYNMGATRVKELVEEKKKPTIYMSAVMRRYLAFYDGLKKKGTVKVRLKEAFQKLKRNSTRKVANELISQNEKSKDVI